MRSPGEGQRVDFVVDETSLRQLLAVHRLTMALHEATSPAAFYEEAIDAVVTTLGVDRAALLLFDPDGVMRFKAWRGLSSDYRQAVEGHTPWSPGDADAKPIVVPEAATDPDLAGFEAVFAAEGIAALAFVPLVHHRRVVGKFMLYYDEPHAYTDAEVAVAEILAAQVAVVLERRRIEDAERAARLEAEAAAARLSSLQRVTSELSGASSMDEVADVVLSTVLRELGAHTGSICLVDGAELEIAYAAGYSDAVVAHWGRFPVAADLPASEAVRTGRPVYISSPTERDARYPVFGSTPVVADEAFAIIPLGDEQPMGCLVAGFAQPRTFTDQEQAFCFLLGARCAAALERARVFEERTVIARTLQASLLPPRFPEIPGVDVGARYAAAGSGVDVGGDFYDLIPLAGGRFLLVLGDVCGRGVQAATLAAMTRHTVRSAAVTVADPASILAHVNEVVLRSQPPDSYEPRFCTALVALLDPTGDGGLSVELAVAGHPLPVIRRADGTVTPVGVPGFLIGVTPEATATPTGVVLGPGDALVCVTDGVLERRNRDVHFGDAAFGALLASAAPAGAEALAAEIEAAALSFAGERPSDDFAVVVVQPRG